MNLSHICFVVVCIGIPYVCLSQQNMSQKQGIDIYCEVRKAQYFGYPIPPEQEQQMLTLKKQYPSTYLELNEITNKAVMPGTRHMPFAWVPRYIDPVAELFSHWFGWHNAILDALRPQVDTYQTRSHEQNVDAYLEAVRHYMYNRYDIESHNTHDIFINLIKQLEPFAVYKLPYRHNIFVQIIPTISQKDLQNAYKKLKSEIPQTYEEKRTLMNAIHSHFGYTKLAIYAISADIEEQQKTT